jgi:hypothetical protein
MACTGALSVRAQDPSPEGQPPKPVHRVPRVETPLKVDGVLDDEVWKHALVLPVNIEVRPGENIVAPVRTEVLLAYGPGHIYAAFRAWDPEPSKIRARYTDRDKIWDDDWVSLTFDTFNDERRAFEFYCNPLGVQLDRIEVTGGGGGEAWDAIWDSAGRITPEGYEAEIAIPFSSLRFQKTQGEQVWSFDAVRSYPRNVRHHIGSFPRDRGNNCYLCQALKIVGFAGADPGDNLELDPTLVGTYAETRERFPGGPFVKKDSKVDPGLTVRWSMTPNLALNATINPDFSQVEADAAQLDINTRFALFYPEKRPFFLEGMDYFETPLPIVYTRTLAQPAWGAKVTGKMGPNMVAAFSVRDEVTNLILPSSQSSTSLSLPGRNTGSVLRYRRDVGDSSTVGVLATDREGADYSNRVFGFDAALRFTPEQTLYLNAYGSQTRYPDSLAAAQGQPEGAFQGYGFDLMYDYSTRDWENYVHFMGYSDDFRADLGFVPQVGYSFFDVGAIRKWYHDDPGHWFNTLSVWGGYELTRDSAKNRLREVYGTMVQYSGPKQSWFNAVFYTGRQSYLGVPFDDTYATGSLGFLPTGDLTLGLGFYYGDAVDYDNIRQAKKLRLSPQVALFSGRHFKLTLNHTNERLWVEGGKLYDANLTELRAVYQFTVRAFFRAILQYTDYKLNQELYTFPVEPQYKNLLTQLLFSYKINPQTALYAGYSDNYDGYMTTPLTQTDRTVFLKVGYAWVR